ncbi:hypothetical protein HK098_006468, partial [Nowakowskiella sp. JEL0407]
MNSVARTYVNSSIRTNRPQHQSMSEVIINCCYTAPMHVNQFRVTMDAQDTISALKGKNVTGLENLLCLGEIVNTVFEAIDYGIDVENSWEWTKGTVVAKSLDVTELLKKWETSLLEPVVVDKRDRFFEVLEKVYGVYFSYNETNGLPGSGDFIKFLIKIERPIDPQSPELNGEYLNRFAKCLVGARFLPDLNEELKRLISYVNELNKKKFVPVFLDEANVLLEMQQELFLFVNARKEQ